MADRVKSSGAATPAAKPGRAATSRDRRSPDLRTLVAPLLGYAESV
jgi:hypothetical protein